MVFVFVDGRVNNRKAYLPIAKKFCEAGRKDKGCIEMEVYMDPKQEDRVVFAMKWENEEAFEVHKKGPAYDEFIPQMIKYLISIEDTMFESV